MYSLEYCEEPKHGELHSSERVFDDSFQVDVSLGLAGLDRFM